MATVRVVRYKQHEIQVRAQLRPRETHFSAGYEIRGTNGVAVFQQGLVVGSFSTVHEAEAEAFKSAMRWVDRNQAG